jgi:putative nucleotidyltransferase with HDIG domain
MSSGKRRPKFPRAILRDFSPNSLQQGRLARRRDRVARLFVVAVAVVAVSALVYGSGPPLSYRLGQRPKRDIRVNVPEFQWPDPIKTTSKRQAEADRVPPSMINDPTPLKNLAERLDDLIEAVPQARSPEALPEDIRAYFAVSPALFADLASATSTPDKLKELRRRLGVAFEPILRDGVLGPNSLTRQEEASRGSFLVRSAGQSADEARVVSLDRVLRERMVRPDLPVQAEFVAAFESPRLGQGLFALLAEKLADTPTLTLDERLTSEQREVARRKVLEVNVSYKRGEVLVEQDKEIGPEHLMLLKKEHESTLASLTFDAKLRRGLSIVVIVASLFLMTGFFVVRHEPKLASDLKRIAIACGLIVAAMATVRLLGDQSWDAELVPVAIAAMILAVAYNPNFALTVTFGLSVMTTMIMGAGIDHFLVLMGGTAAAVLTLDEVRTRTKLIKVGATAALAYFLLTWAAGLFQEQAIGLVLRDSLWRAGWGLMAGFFLGGSLPFVETAFGIVTGISLLELGDVTHPLLQELVRRAPGTHNHSITVGSIAESAAEKIGADALLVRIGAYFHDIGKMLKPHYFVENVSGSASRHANLAPAMSTLIIIGHVKDGVDLGRQHHLPEPIIHLIEQHHGTTLVEYFYHEATRRNGSNPDASTVLESAFRYPGPKPQTREAAILMMSDCVESASRTLSEPTPARIEGLVRDLIEKRLHDGQLDECGLTLREIGEIRESLIKSIIGIYHVRVKYPEQRTA